VPTFHVPKPGERPDVEALVDGVWCPGELRMWTQDDEGAWTAQVQYRPPGSHSRVIGAFPAEHVRGDTIDRSDGRRK
jgi:hypothetical protein